MPRIDFDEEKHEYTVDGTKVPGVTEILEALTAKHYGEISKEVLQQAKDRGTAVHAACEDLDYGFEVEYIPAEWVGYVNAYAAFLNDYRPKWHGIEEMVYNPEQQYCGRVDRYGLIDGKMAVLDIKTTTSPTKQNYMAGACQTVAYGKALVGVKKGFLLYLQKSGGYRLVDTGEWAEKHDFNAEKVWDLCLELYNETEGRK